MAEEFKLVGKRGVRRPDGYAKASGRAEFTYDVQLPGMLYAKILTSPYAHAKIKSMDTSKAEAFPGVKAILRYDDPELSGIVGGITGRAVLPGVAYFEGDFVGAVVAADSEEIAEQALGLIEIDWEERSFILDWEKALEPGAPMAYPERYPESNLFPAKPIEQHGDIEKGFAEADEIIEFQAMRQEHTAVGVEPPCCVARWIGDYIELWIKTQFFLQAEIAVSQWLNVPTNRIKVHVLYQGGSYGGWGVTSYCNLFHCIAVLLSRRTQSPVKLVCSRRNDFTYESWDINSTYLKAGAKNDGTITAVQIRGIFGNNGGMGALGHFVKNTKIPNLWCEELGVAVNRGQTVSIRCEQLPNCLSFTLVFDRVATALGLDPTEVALKNNGYDGHDMAWVFENVIKVKGFPEIDSLKECIEKGKKASDWDNKWHEPGVKKMSNGKMHGIAFTWTHEWNPKPDPWLEGRDAAVLIDHDGSVTILGMLCDCGVNAAATYCQVAAEELGVPYKDVSCRLSDDTGFILKQPAGASGLVSNAYVIREAAAMAKKALLARVAPSFKVTPEELDVEDGEVYVKAEPSNRKKIAKLIGGYPAMAVWGGRVTPPIIAWTWDSYTQYRAHPPEPSLNRQCYFMEVEVDPETGEVEVTKVVCVNDVGKAISPETCEGQQYGGAYMGVSRGHGEAVIYDPMTGVKLNDNLIDYKYAAMLDYGPIDTILVETGQGYGPYGTCGIGEDIPSVLPALLGPAVYNAIGKWIDDFPITPDKVLKALGKA